MAKNLARFSLLAAALAISVHAGAAADFDTPDEISVRSERVSTADLNLANVEGRETLRWRLRAAARRVCRDVIDAGSGRFAHSRDCRKAAFRSALAHARLEVHTARNTR